MKANSTPSNALPDKPTELFPVADGMIAGLLKHETSLGVVQNTAAAVGKDLTAAVAAHETYEALKSEPAAVLYPVLHDLELQVDKFIELTKSVLQVHLGRKWTKFWAEAGFANRSLSIPTTMPGREKLLKSLVTYFTNHPDQESKKPEVTSARSAQLLAAFSAARQAVKDQPTPQKAGRIDRDKTVATLRKRLRATIAELNLKLESDSDLWGAFGLTAPALIGRRRAKKNLQPTETAAATSARSATPDSSAVALAV